jgi:hypothetical protein
LFNLLYFCYKSDEHAKTHARQETNKAAVIIEHKLKEIETVVNDYAVASSTRIIPDAELKVMFEKGLKSNQALFGILIAYAPYQFSPAKKLHSIASVSLAASSSSAIRIFFDMKKRSSTLTVFFLM